MFEQAGRALFVDGVDGSNDGDGSRAEPFRDLSVALETAEARANGTDVYLRAVDGAYTVDATVTKGSSVYGGYDADWVRSGARRTLIGGRLEFTGRRSIVISSIDLRGFDDTDGPALGVSRADSVRIVDSVVRAGNTSVGTSIAVAIEDAGSVEIIATEIYGGQAGSGVDGAPVATPDPPLVTAPPVAMRSARSVVPRRRVPPARRGVTAARGSSPATTAVTAHPVVRPVRTDRRVVVVQVEPRVPPVPAGSASKTMDCRGSGSAGRRRTAG